MRHCSLGVSCPPEWAKSMHPDLVCAGCWQRDIALAREAIEKEEEWRAARWASVAERVDTMKIRARRHAEREMLHVDVGVLRQAVLEKQRARIKAQQRVDDLRQRLRAAKDIRARQRARDKTASDAVGGAGDGRSADLASVYRPQAPPRSRLDTQARQRVVELTQRRIRDLRQVIPLRMCDHSHHTGVVVCEGLCIPVSIAEDTIQAFSETRISAAVGLIARATNVLAHILDVPLPYVVHEHGSHSSISVCVDHDEDKAATSWGWATLGGLFAPHTKKSDASTELLLPLWIRDNEDVGHRAKFLKAVAVLNVNIATILHTHRVRVAPHRPPAVRSQGTRGCTVFTLLHCLSQFLSDGELQSIVPPGHATWRGHMLTTARPAAKLRIYSGVYGGTLNVREGVGGEGSAARRATVLYYVQLKVQFAPNGGVYGELRIATEDALRRGGGDRAPVPPSEKISGVCQLSEGFTIRTDTLRMKGDIVVGAAPPTLHGTWSIAPHSNVNASAREFVLHMKPAPYIELSPVCREEKHIQSVQPTSQSHDYLLNDAYFGHARTKHSDDTMSDGSDGWEILDHGCM